METMRTPATGSTEIIITKETLNFGSGGLSNSQITRLLYIIFYLYKTRCHDARVLPCGSQGVLNVTMLLCSYKDLLSDWLGVAIQLLRCSECYIVCCYMVAKVF